MKTIKSYLRKFDEFEHAYGKLKELYRDEVNAYCNSLELVEKGKAVIIGDLMRYPLSVPLSEKFSLIACENDTMMIMEIPDFD